MWTHTSRLPHFDTSVLLVEPSAVWCTWYPVLRSWRSGILHAVAVDPPVELGGPTVQIGVGLSVQGVRVC